jgi:pyruvate dehydrogenase E2 component (dihydrolipoamide acetyltransferase)
MPKWGLSMKEGKVVDWLVADGDEIAVGTELMDVETDKINGTVEAPDAGRLRRLVAEEGQTYRVKALLGVLADETVSDADIDAFIAGYVVPVDEDDEDEDLYAFTEVDGIKVRYSRQGSSAGQTVVLLHGFGGDLDNWMFALPALAEGHRVYALDLPGHGGSSKDVGAGDVDALAAAVIQFLDSQGLDRAHLAGHSLGGLVAATVALAGRARTLTLVAGAGLGPEINGEYIEGFVAAETRRELKPVLQLLFADPGQVTRQLVDDVLKYKRIDGVDGALRAIAGHVFPPEGQAVQVAGRLAELDVAVLVIWGAQDGIIPAEHARNAPQGAEVHVLDGVGHSPHMEAAAEVNRLVGAFLAGARA